MIVAEVTSGTVSASIDIGEGTCQSVGLSLIHLSSNLYTRCCWILQKAWTFCDHGRRSSI